MIDFGLLLSKRKFDNLPISVGTSLAIEALQDNDKFDTLWINVRTLYRNILHAVEEKEDRDLLLSPTHLEEASSAIAAAISQETEVIRNYLNNRIDGVRLYCLGYSDLARRFPKARLRKPHTALQIAQVKLMDEVINKVLADDFDQHIRWDKGSELEGEYTRSCIITSYPVDLLSRTKFKTLKLLESHTGAIKPKSQWYTKLTNGKDLGNIPFNRFTIQIFGDGNLQFEQWPKKFRNSIIGIAEEYLWTPVTTLDRIRFSLNRMRDKYSGDMLKSLL